MLMLASRKQYYGMKFLLYKTPNNRINRKAASIQNIFLLILCWKDRAGRRCLKKVGPNFESPTLEIMGSSNFISRPAILGDSGQVSLVRFTPWFYQRISQLHQQEHQKAYILFLLGRNTEGSHQYDASLVSSDTFHHAFVSRNSLSCISQLLHVLATNNYMFTIINHILHTEQTEFTHESWNRMMQEQH